MKFKLSIFLLITILLISGGYLVWISYGQDIVDKYIITPSPTPDPYAGWKTYTNEEYGFSIKYPSSSLVNTRNDMSSNKKYIFDLKNSEPSQTELVEGFNITAIIINKPTTQSIEDYINQHIRNYLITNPTDETAYIQDQHYTSISEKNNYIVDNHRAISYEYKEYWQENNISGFPIVKTYKFYLELDSNQLILFTSAIASKDRKITNISEYSIELNLIINSIKYIN